MPEDLRPQPRPGRNGDGTGRPEPARRFSGGVVLFFMAAALLVALGFFAFLGNPQTMTYHEFQRRYWKDPGQRYDGLLEARLRDDILQIRPETPASVADAAKPGRAGRIWYA
ncbi:MAG TPA: hypothetical protein VNC50_06765, partial [Planctomycetia bacterium]|nr:hypothetical protein [Planctomycetia bacterium]